MDCNGMNLYELISGADQILLYNTTNARSSTISGQQIIQDLMDEDVALLQRCVYGCVEHQAQMQQRENAPGSGSKPKDAAASEKKSGSKDDGTSEDIPTEGAHREPTENIDDNERDRGNVGAAAVNILICKVSQPSGGIQDGP